MRKAAAALFFIAILGMLVPPAFAQAPAPAPAPKVTINGLVDFVVTKYSNWSGGNGQGGGGGIAASDMTNPNDKGFYSRERGVFTITGEVGRSKGVWAIELDFVNGAGIVGNSGNAFNGGNQGASQSGTSGNFDLDTDVASLVETKWLYVETPITGPGSLMPFIPVTTIFRGGAQPFQGHDYKFGIHASGDFPGANFRTTWAPNITSTITYAQIGERLDKVIAPNANDDYAVLASLEWEIFKGFTVKPTYSYADYTGGNCGAGALGTAGANGFSTNSCGAAPPTLPLATRRHTIGGDVRWTSGPWSLQPTFYYQFGDQEIINNQAGVPAGTTKDVDISAFIFDTTGGFSTGPLNIQARFMYTTGMDARQQVQNGATVGYYRPINSGFGYMSGWSDIWTGGIDYITAAIVGVSGMTLRESPSYDKYGRIFLAGAVDYSLTPALILRGTANVSWSAEKVDTRSLFTANGLAPCPATGPALSCTSDGKGKENYLGTEIAAGLTYRFAPNVAFDFVAAYLFAGNGLNHMRSGTDGKVKDADDVFKTTARLRFTF